MTIQLKARKLPLGSYYLLLSIQALKFYFGNFIG